MKRVLVPIANGSEEIEAITLVDVLRRAGCHVTLASIETSLHISASRGVNIIADCFISDCEDEIFDLVALPGGMPGATNLAQSQALSQILERQRQRMGAIGAICAAPAVVLGSKGWLKGKKVTGYPAFWQQLRDQGALVSDALVVQDGTLFTSQGPASAMAFAVTLAKFLVADETAQAVCEGLLLDKPWS
jgi:protein deglycase